jgi:antitoxin VapB
MGINIKNRVVEGHIRELAELTGEGKTEAIDKAVRERLERVRADKSVGLAERIIALAREFRRELGDEPLPDIDTMLYDPETGLPRDD